MVANESEPGLKPVSRPPLITKWN